jgi:hypothetical protein
MSRPRRVLLFAIDLEMVDQLVDALILLVSTWCFTERKWKPLRHLCALPNRVGPSLSQRIAATDRPLTSFSHLKEFCGDKI